MKSRTVRHDDGRTEVHISGPHGLSPDAAERRVAAKALSDRKEALKAERAEMMAKKRAPRPAPPRGIKVAKEVKLAPADQLRMQHTEASNPEALRAAKDAYRAVVVEQVAREGEAK